MISDRVGQSPGHIEVIDFFAEDVKRPGVFVQVVDDGTQSGCGSIRCRKEASRRVDVDICSRHLGRILHVFSHEVTHLVFTDGVSIFDVVKAGVKVLHAEGFHVGYTFAFLPWLFEKPEEGAEKLWEDGSKEEHVEDLSDEFNEPIDVLSFVEEAESCTDLILCQKGPFT